MPEKINRTVVRNAAYTIGEFNIRERHNERKNESYHNGDIDPERADMNIHFRRVLSPDGTPETYEQTFKRLLDENVISTRGQKTNGTAKVFDELIFDVNTAYFEENGGYEYAKEFFAEAYRCAVNEVGGEQFVLSAVLHADERNKALSEELGRDVYHYHLHVVYIPVVQKEILWSKRTKDKSLVGKLKEVITQVSHSKKWPQRMPVERDGKTIMLNAYSLLQDRFFEHMKSAGFGGFERGERGSTAVHLSDLEYKTKKETERLAGTTATLEQKKIVAVRLEKKISNNENQLAMLNKKLSISKKAADEIDTLDSIGTKNLVGQIVITPDELKTVKNIIRRDAKTQEVNNEISKRNAQLLQENTRLKTRLKSFEGRGMTDKMEYFQARHRAPNRMAEIIAEIMRQPPEKSVEQKLQRDKKYKKPSGEEL